MAVSNYASYAANQTASGTAAAGDQTATQAIKKNLGKEDFLKLLVTQLRFQDPMSPDDPKEFVAQLAQISSLEQQINVNKSLENVGQLVSSLKDSLGMSRGVNLLGKTVKGLGNSLSLAGGQATGASYQLPRDAKEVQVSIFDGARRLVRTLNLSSQAAGLRQFSWDGKNAGTLTPATILVVDHLPPHNTGAFIHDFSEFIFDDAAIVACLMRQWRVVTGLIGTTLGDDVRGRRVVRQLKTLGVRGRFSLSKQIRTPVEVDVSDRTGARTYFWQRDKRFLDTLDTADLSLLHGAQMLYVDWYDGDHILRAMTEAQRLAIPVFLNLEHGHRDPAILHRYVSRATIVQAVTDSAQMSHRDPIHLAQKLLHAGAQTALVTLAGEGCLALNANQAVRVHAPQVQVVVGMLDEFKFYLW